jgi:hypothetical protein
MIGTSIDDVDLRARIWTLHLRGLSFTAIGKDVDRGRETVARVVRACYHELRQDREDALLAAQDEAIAHMRHVQQQAWADHDEDDRREREILAREGDAPVRYTSQRAAYLRVALDAEREIARLRGLYSLAAPAQGLDDSAQFIFRIERVERVEPPEPAGLGMPAAPLALPAATGATDATGATAEGEE